MSVKQANHVTLTTAEQQTLLSLARTAIHAAVTDEALPVLSQEDLTEALLATKACFITLKRKSDDSLRGCTGVLTARKPLAEEIVFTAAQTAMSDPRFPPVTPEELNQLEVEISILTPPTPLPVQDPLSIPDALRPGVDGVILRKGLLSGTFLPQVWDRIPDPAAFLGRLCKKMGLPASEWQNADMQIHIYQVEEFSENLPVGK